MESIGNKIRIQRLTKNYSQEYMAFMLEISQPAYSKIERDETELSIKRIYEIAEVLEINPFNLLPPSKFGTGINYLKIRRSIYKMKGFFLNKIANKKAEASQLNIIYSDTSNT